MNEPTLFEAKTVTTKELADSLGVDAKTIQRAVDSLDINVARQGSSHTMVFTEPQATAIKIELQNHSKIAQNGFTTLTISNDLDMMLMQQKLTEYQSKRIAELTAENEQQKKQLIEQEPKVTAWDKYMDDDGTVCVTKIATCIGVMAKDIFDELANHRYIYRDSTKHNQWMASAFGVQNGYVINKAFSSESSSYSGMSLKVTKKGMELIAKWHEKGFFSKLQPKKTSTWNGGF